jgi:uncharacterized membrane protein YozB (DUF420 family)
MRGALRLVVTGNYKYAYFYALYVHIYLSHIQCSSFLRERSKTNWARSSHNMYASRE